MVHERIGIVIVVLAYHPTTVGSVDDARHCVGREALNVFGHALAFGQGDIVVLHRGPHGLCN